MSPPYSFYQRPLPDSCIAFASDKGKEVFASALHNKGLKSFFNLIQQFTTQSEPAFCGLSTLVLVLNALAVDPLQNWKGPWRWYEESMLNCCLDLEDVKTSGITLKDFQCLAHCQGLSVDSTYCDEQSTLEDFRKAVEQACVEKEGEDQGIPQVLVVSYARGVLGQTGSGHFSPLAAYDAESDNVLILDTARFKYGAHWAKLPLVYEAMKPIDPDTNMSRGYALLSFRPTVCQVIGGDTTGKSIQPMSLLFRSKMTQHPTRREYKELLDSLGREITWSEAAAFWKEDKSKVAKAWSILEPLRYPSDETGKARVERLRSLLKEMLHQNIEKPYSCCQGKKMHSNCVSGMEALYIVYLASLEEENRKRLVTDFPSKADCTTRVQLLNEAGLIAAAIRWSDQSTY
eukprot:Nitzschia sp. Nitz4//scaffold2_size372955//265589//266934//NITZ4_000453-RA/size372955-snap-gene-0.44-mRNA-1//1//CDS//3329546868//5481//frame0